MNTVLIVRKNLPLTLAVVAALGVLFFSKPAGQWFYPPCLFHELTGWECPGCGATRALAALLRGRFAEAFRDNALLLVLAAWLAAEKMLRRKTFLATALGWWFLGAAAVAFAVARNLPGGEWLAP